MKEKNKKYLAIGAHFDDIEIGAGGFIARERTRGNIVKVIVVANGDYDSLNGQKIRTKQAANSEGAEAIRHMGLEAEDITCLGYPETGIPYNKEIICKIERIINNFSPDIILTQWVHDSHQDHINTALSVISAARYKHSLLMWEPIFPSGRFSTIPFVPQLYVDISVHINQKIKAIESHQSQVKKFSEQNIKWIGGIVARAKFRGFECQADYAETFFVYRIKYE
ncbi:MAG: PIG-L family deacetylase [Candidatus Roizmanbacteria bacterium]|nr:PIG-L family deacetylase [Candidatus Roizmanbacteria bacterium]